MNDEVLSIKGLSGGPDRVAAMWMNLDPLRVNLVVAWLWMLFGFGSGFLLGLRFHRDDWMGGYGSLKRRLYRLAHISFFGLAAVNFMFYLTVRSWETAGWTVDAASWSLVAGAVAMPLCCVAMAHFPRFRVLFAFPVFSLLLGGCLTLWEVLRS